MPKFYRQNKKRINPRYFLHEKQDMFDDLGSSNFRSTEEYISSLKADNQIKWKQFNAELAKELGLTLVENTFKVFVITALIVLAALLAFLYKVGVGNNKELKKKQKEVFNSYIRKGSQKLFATLKNNQNLKSKIKNKLQETGYYNLGGDQVSTG